MPTRLSGTLRISIRFTGDVNELGKGKYAGAIRALGKGVWRFSELWMPRPPIGQTWHSPEMLDRAAAAAVYYGGQFSPEEGHEPEEIPTWAPKGELALAIRNNREVFPEAVLGADRPEVAHVYVAQDNTVVFRTAPTRAAYYAALEKLARQRRERPRLRLLQGGLAV